ncbi:hypothetical protein PGT21_023768 [Puccinia graminis f. sp. tritici]|uniref:Uncharacterized protein n=1 Tax=Puccinia graminis f. sp. tritici TaxID=56615 RepID=A0A5B0MRZ7_PUCGR|nr:hypothetical protein PGT21_023768 [Puccinia graminis f. sp. tritici]
MFMSGGKPVTGPLEPAQHYIRKGGQLKSQLSQTSASAHLPTGSVQTQHPSRLRRRNLASTGLPCIPRGNLAQTHTAPPTLCKLEDQLLCCFRAETSPAGHGHPTNTKDHQWVVHTANQTSRPSRKLASPAWLKPECHTDKLLGRSAPDEPPSQPLWHDLELAGLLKQLQRPADLV